MILDIILVVIIFALLAVLAYYTPIIKKHEQDKAEINPLPMTESEMFDDAQTLLETLDKPKPVEVIAYKASDGTLFESIVAMNDYETHILNSRYVSDLASLIQICYGQCATPNEIAKGLVNNKETVIKLLNQIK